MTKQTQRLTPDQVAEALKDYVPLLASPEHGPLIKDLAVFYRPTNHTDARRAASALGGLVYWAEQTGRNINPDQLLDHDLIDYYADSALQNLAVATRIGRRSDLHRTAKGRAGRNVGTRPKREKANVSPPYTPDEVDALLLWADRQPSPKRARSMLALLVLGLGAGLGPSDIAGVAGTDVRRDPATGAVSADVTGARPRTVTFLERYEENALHLAATAGQHWIVNPDVDFTPRTRSALIITNQINEAYTTTDAPRLSVARCRVTWTCHHLAAGTRLDVIATAAGYKDANAVARYAHFVTPLNTQAAHTMLRRAQPPDADSTNP